MLLCDIGNTSFHFYDGSRDWRHDVATFDPASLTQEIAYICVNSEVSLKLAKLANWIDLALHVKRDSYYETMGIDRIMACEFIDNGVIIDAGSAITVDYMKAGCYEGGFIYPGINAMQYAFASISPRLKYPFNFDVDLGKMPKNSQDAISYGFLAPLQSLLSGFDAPLILTGGDAPLLKPLFEDAQLEPLLLFCGMAKIIDKGRLC